jgi:hypothetical protein
MTLGNMRDWPSPQARAMPSKTKLHELSWPFPSPEAIQR